MFTARYDLSPYIKLIRFVLKGLVSVVVSCMNISFTLNLCVLSSAVTGEFEPVEMVCN